MKIYTSNNLFQERGFSLAIFCLDILLLHLPVTQHAVYSMVKELKDVIRTVPEVGGLIGHEDAGKLITVKENHGGNDAKYVLQSAFAKLMMASKETVSEAVNKLKYRLNDESKVKTSLIQKVCVHLHFILTTIYHNFLYFVCITSYGYANFPSCLLHDFFIYFCLILYPWKGI
jgi:hypothetical protein